MLEQTVEDTKALLNLLDKQWADFIDGFQATFSEPLGSEHPIFSKLRSLAIHRRLASRGLIVSALKESAAMELER